MTDEVWFTRDYGSETGKALSMSKSVLGLFVFHLLRLGGRINSTYALNAKYDRSYVQMSITLPSGKREELEKLSGIALEAPSVLVPACSNYVKQIFSHYMKKGILHVNVGQMIAHSGRQRWDLQLVQKELDEALANGTVIFDGTNFVLTDDQM